MHAIASKPDAQAYQQNIMEFIEYYGIPMHSMGSEPDAQAYPQNVMEFIESYLQNITASIESCPCCGMQKTPHAKFKIRASCILAQACKMGGCTHLAYQ